MPPLSLAEVLATVPDPRSRKGRIHPLSAILSLTVVAILAGAKGLDAIAQFGRDHGPPLYKRWYVWAAAGVLVAGATAGAYAYSQRDPDRITGF